MLDKRFHHPLLLGGVIALVIHLILNLKSGGKIPDLGNGSARASKVYLTAALLTSALLLLNNLGGFEGTTLNWERREQLYDAFFQGQSIPAYWMKCLLWDSGLMTSGENSIFYGAPTYTLVHLVGFSTWSIRFISVILTILSVVAIYCIGRRFFGQFIGGTVAVLLALNWVALFYGRYATSPAGTLLAVLLAIFFAWLFLDSDRPQWWKAPLCAFSIYLATLQYAPGRIAVLVLLGLIIVVPVSQWRRISWSRVIGVALILLSMYGIWVIQKKFHRTHLLFSARGEQYFQIRKSPSELKYYLNRDVSPNNATLGDNVDLIYRIFRVTVPQYIWFLSPHTDTASEKFLTYEPPKIPLYYAPLCLFILIGFLHSACKFRHSWRHGFLLAWVAFATVPLLLTNRVDDHRIMLFIVPLSFWAAFGLWEAARAMKGAGVPILFQHIFAIVLMLLMLHSDIIVLFYNHIPEHLAVMALSEEIKEIPGPVALGSTIDHRDRSFLELDLLERSRRSRREVRSSKILEWALLKEMNEDYLCGRPVRESHLRELEKILATSSLILAPKDQFATVGRALEQRGHKLITKSRHNFDYLLFPHGDFSEQVPGKATPGHEPEPLPSSPVTVEIALPKWEGPMVMLDELNPQKTEYGFAPPKLNKTWEQKPIVMNNISYSHGIGMHAWCKMTYAVPENTKAFQAIIGYSDIIRHKRPDAEATFSLYAGNGRLLYYSDAVTAGSPPKPIIVNIKGVRLLTLETTEGRDGRDHDHLNWANAAFLMESKPEGKGTPNI